MLTTSPALRPAGRQPSPQFSPLPLLRPIFDHIEEQSGVISCRSGSGAGLSNKLDMKWRLEWQA
jgi:hypothetical protein